MYESERESVSVCVYSPTMSVTWFVCPLNVLTIFLVSVSTISITKLSHDTANMELQYNYYT